MPGGGGLPPRRTARRVPPPRQLAPGFGNTAPNVSLLWKKIPRQTTSAGSIHGAIVGMVLPCTCTSSSSILKPHQSHPGRVLCYELHPTHHAIGAIDFLLDILDMHRYQGLVSVGALEHAIGSREEAPLGAFWLRG